MRSTPSCGTPRTASADGSPLRFDRACGKTAVTQRVFASGNPHTARSHLRGRRRRVEPGQDQHGAVRGSSAGGLRVRPVPVPVPVPVRDGRGAGRAGFQRGYPAGLRRSARFPASGRRGGWWRPAPPPSLVPLRPGAVPGRVSPGSPLGRPVPGGLFLRGSPRRRGGFGDGTWGRGDPSAPGRSGAGRSTPSTAGVRTTA
jgi:hypothetical protein